MIKQEGDRIFLVYMVELTAAERKAIEIAAEENGLDADEFVDISMFSRQLEDFLTTSKTFLALEDVA